MFLRDIDGFLAIAGLPALFLVGWVAFWVFLRHVPVWSFGVASGLSAASIMLAWAVSSGGSPSGAAGDRSAIAIYGLFFNGITGLLWVGMLGIVTAIIELIRMGLHRGAPETVSAKETAPVARRA
jgi:hypothetical protein